jgi:hypothetical protein
MILSMKFKSKENRDREALIWKARGDTVVKRSSRNVVLSPNYVKDEDLSNASPNGFGGYDTSWYPVIYTLEVR